MERLELFGFPVTFNESDNMLIPDAKGISYEQHSRKLSKGMFGLLADKNYCIEDDPYYDFYLSIGVDADREKFKAVNLRYDSTVIMQGCAGDEFKKTAGHFHCDVPGKGMSYPEYYQVIKGKALFVMQRVNNYCTEGSMVVEDAILAEVNAGESIVIPPNYGHCTVNISDETMVFVNLVSCSSTNYYDSVKKSVGMCCYIKKGENGGYIVEKNPSYQFTCEPKIVTPTDNDTLGIHKGVPVYTQFLNAPDKFAYLNSPENNMSDYFAVFAAK